MWNVCPILSGRLRSSAARADGGPHLRPLPRSLSQGLVSRSSLVLLAAQKQCGAVTDLAMSEVATDEGTPT